MRENPIRFQIGIQLESNFVLRVSSNLNFKYLCQVSYFNVKIRSQLEFNFVPRVSSNLNFKYLCQVS